MPRHINDTDLEAAPPCISKTSGCISIAVGGIANVDKRERAILRLLYLCENPDLNKNNFVLGRYLGGMEKNVCTIIYIDI